MARGAQLWLLLMGSIHHTSCPQGSPAWLLLLLGSANVTSRPWSSAGTPLPVREHPPALRGAQGIITVPPGCDCHTSFPLTPNARTIPAPRWPSLLCHLLPSALTVEPQLNLWSHWVHPCPRGCCVVLVLPSPFPAPSRGDIPTWNQASLSCAFTVSIPAL